jgi:threonine dehydrogenase-like Zn-dependent dehydrogenase
MNALARGIQHAAVLLGGTRSKVMERELPEPAAGEVRIRLQGCGVCASNLPVWEGRSWFNYPLASGAPGHEGWGIVDATGEGVDNVDIGDRVAAITGHAYAQFDTAPAESLVTLPRELDALPFPGEPLGCAMNIVERSDIRPQHTVAIVGAGFLGLLLTQLISKTGAQVIVVSRRAFALDQAKRCGALATFSLDDSSRAGEEAMRTTGNRGFDRVIEVAGLQSSLDVASSLAAEYGRLVIAGYHQDGLRQVNMQQWNWRALDVINAHERSPEKYVNGIRNAVQAVMRGDMDPFPLLTHTVGLNELDRAFDLTRSRPEGFIKAIVDMEAIA